jgi:four helix bundle protein
MDYFFDHEKLDVYKVSLEFVAWVTELIKGLPTEFRHPKDQLIRSSQSITQNIAEGNGKRPGPDRKRFFEISRGSALESASTLDILVAVGAKKVCDVNDGKKTLHRLVSMLTKMAPPPN